MARPSYLSIAAALTSGAISTAIRGYESTTAPIMLFSGSLAYLIETLAENPNDPAARAILKYIYPGITNGLVTLAITSNEPAALAVAIATSYVAIKLTAIFPEETNQILDRYLGMLRDRINTNRINTNVENFNRPHI